MMNYVIYLSFIEVIKILFTKILQMNLPIKLVCKTRKLKKDGTVGIAVQYCLNSDRRVTLESGVSIFPKYWNKKNNCILNTLPTESGNVEQLNKKLNEEIVKAKYIVLYSIQNN